MASKSGYALVIVESPTKARTIRRFLGRDFVVEASMGHVRDLPSKASEVPASAKGKPWAKLAVDVERGFEPLYVIPSEKRKAVATLRTALKEAGELYLATDEDREGESIAWHLVEVLKPSIPIHRLVFHEITRGAIERALASPRQIDEHLVQAQEARRVLDRLVGYIVSPLLWKKVAPRLSAGRVQSVAVRLLVIRERERRAFVPASWWDIEAHAVKDGSPFTAQLAVVGGRAVATGKDFDDATGRLKAGRETEILLLDEAGARALAARLAGKELQVTAVERKESTRPPYPPFTTSTLQQEAHRKLGLHASETMRTAQQLYEKGHITYMRTDSVNLAEEAIGVLRSVIEARFGRSLLSPRPRRFATKSKGAQEAHEAIRPAGTVMAAVGELGLAGREAALYDLIWKRAVATQMADARIARTTVSLAASDPEDGPVEFRARGQQIIFPGFLRAYVEGSDDPNGLLDDREAPLPDLREGDRVEVRGLEALGHETRPPGRYTEATLVKALETQGIGRPSTYATIIETIQRRGYARTFNKTLVPTFTAMAVTQLLEETLAKIVDVEFTASMEEWLDRIAVGGDPKEYLGKFYRNDLLRGIAQGEKIDARQVCTLEYENLGPYRIRVGRYGPYVRVGEDGENSSNGNGEKAISIPEDVAPADVNLALLEDLIHRAAKGEEPLGIDPASKLPVYVRVGRFGPYIQLGDGAEPNVKPKRVSVPRGLEVSRLRLEVALSLLALPRELGRHPEDNELVCAGVGRFGPYVRHGSLFASLRKEDDVLTIGLERALELLAAKKRGAGPRRRGGGVARQGRRMGAEGGTFSRQADEEGADAGAEDQPGDEREDEAVGEASVPESARRTRKAQQAAVEGAAAKRAPKKVSARKVSARKKATRIRAGDGK
ncbi:MAG: type I DNA topoisomerase [Planctomycetota bacterium]